MAAVLTAVLTAALAGCGRGVGPVVSAASESPSTPTSAAPTPSESPSTPASAAPDASQCPAGTPPETVHSASIYYAVLKDLLAGEVTPDEVKAVYLIDQFTPAEDFGDESSSAAPDPADTARFPADLSACFEGRHAEGVPTITLVHDSDDKRIPREGVPTDAPQPAMEPHTVGAAVVEVSRIPTDAATVVVAASVINGGGDYRGAEYHVTGTAPAWTVRPGQQWIS